ncbi:MAG: type II toxin-antitoxin system VapC family toxin [Thermoanaerobaculia bacterium]
MRFVVDASVALKWFVPEPGRDHALRLFDHALSSPDLLLPEFANALWKKERRGEITRERGRAILSEIRKFAIDIRPSRALIDLAFVLATQTGATVYDSVYLSLAAAEGSVLVTADRRLLERCHNRLLSRSVIPLEDLP